MSNKNDLLAVLQVLKKYNLKVIYETNSENIGNKFFVLII